MNKILTVGSATLDLFFQSNNFPEINDGMRLSLAYGGKYVADSFDLAFGGGGANTAVSFSRQGFETYCWAKIANDWAGKHILENLKNENVDLQLIQKDSDRTTTSAILLGKDRERTIITYRGENDNLILDEKVKNVFNQVSWLYFADLARASKENKLSWLKTMKKNGIKQLITLSGDEYKKGIDYLDEYFEYADIFIVNAHELADIWGGDAPDLDLEKTNYAKKLGLKMLVVTYDINGSWAYTQDKIYHQPIVKVDEVADTTGAGDAFGAGFLGEYIRTNSIPKALQFAAKNSSSVISHISTQKGLLHVK